MRVHETLLRGYLAHGSVVRTTRSPDEPRVRAALSDGVRELITASGGVRSEDEYRYLIGTAELGCHRPPQDVVHRPQRPSKRSDHTRASVSSHDRSLLAQAHQEGRT